MQKHPFREFSFVPGRMRCKEDLFFPNISHTATNAQALHWRTSESLALMADEASALTEPASPGVFIASPALEVAVQLDSLHPPSTFLALSFVHGSCLFFRLLASRRFASWSPICVIPVPCLARGHGRGCCTAGSRPRC